jgi:predicted alpha/beta-fold hydrolase
VITSSTFRPAWWLPGPHLQTLYPSLFRTRSAPRLARQRLELPDGDFVDLDWTPRTGGMVVLVLHGLEGNLESHYTGAILRVLAQQGYNAGLLYFRNCSGEPNRLPRSYHSGDTGDLDFAIRHIRQTFPDRDIAVVGYSLGGNVLLKWLGEQADAAPARTAIAISVPFDLNSAALKLETGLSRIYQRHLLKKLSAAVLRKAPLHPPPFPLERLQELQTFRQFDNAITAPLNGFRDVDDYYDHSSCRQYLHDIRTPTLIIQARDDPFLPPAALPSEDDLDPAVTLELARHGGHVGFITGSNPLQPRYWLEQRILQHLSEFGRQHQPGPGENTF